MLDMAVQHIKNLQKELQVYHIDLQHRFHFVMFLFVLFYFIYDFFFVILDFEWC